MRLIYTYKDLKMDYHTGSKARRLCIFAQIARETVILPLLLDVLVVIVKRTSWFGMLSECTPFGYEVVRERLN